MNLCAAMLFGVGVLCLEPQQQNPVVVDTSCEAFEIIRWSRRDTDQTIAAIKEYNAVWAALCSENEVAGQ